MNAKEDLDKADIHAFVATVESLENTRIADADMVSGCLKLMEKAESELVKSTTVTQYSSLSSACVALLAKLDPENDDVKK